MGGPGVTSWDPSKTRPQSAQCVSRLAGSWTRRELPHMEQERALLPALAPAPEASVTLLGRGPRPYI